MFKLTKAKCCWALCRYLRAKTTTVLQWRPFFVSLHAGRLWLCRPFPWSVLTLAPRRLPAAFARLRCVCRRCRTLRSLFWSTQSPSPRVRGLQRCCSLAAWASLGQAGFLVHRSPITGCAFSSESRQQRSRTAPQWWTPSVSQLQRASSKIQHSWLTYSCFSGKSLFDNIFQLSYLLPSYLVQLLSELLVLRDELLNLIHLFIEKLKLSVS